MKKVLFLLISFQLIFYCKAQVRFFVAPSGSDNNSGTFEKPFGSPGFAIKKALGQGGKDVIIELRKGNYGLQKPIEINSISFKPRSLAIRGYGKEKVVISG